MSLALWTIIIAIFAALPCAWLGTWLVLRREAMTGDAISHAILPGLAGVFVIFGTREPVPMLIGAAAAGLLTVAVTRFVTRVSGTYADTSLGVVFTTMFALGVVLITRYAEQIDLDPGCVLYGLIELTVLDTVRVGAWEIPRVLGPMLAATTLVGGFLAIGHRAITFVSFDRRFADSVWRGAGWWEAALSAMVAVAVVACFEAVGAILVVAMLVAPAAAAQCLTRRLIPMFGLATGFAVGGSAAGYALAAAANSSVAGCIAAVLFAQFLLMWVANRFRVS